MSNEPALYITSYTTSAARPFAIADSGLEKAIRVSDTWPQQ